MKCWLFFFGCFVSYYSFSQNDSVQKAVTLHVLAGQVHVHTNSVRNVKGTKSFGVQVDIAKQSTSFQQWNLSGSFVKTGWSLEFVNFNNSILGHGFIASRFIEPQYRISNHLQFLVRASLGIDYLSNPNNQLTNPTNNNYSLYINPYLHIGSGLQYQFSKNAAIGLAGNFHHISNGNLKQPNKGVNWLTGAINFSYYPNNGFLPKYKRIDNPFWKHQKPIIDIGLFAVPAQGYYSKYSATRNFILGVTSKITKQIGAIHAMTAGTEIYYDNFIVDKNQPPISSKMIVGIQAGHVFLLGKVNFSQQLGYNIYNGIYFLPNFYHRWGIDYQLTPHYKVGANLKANSDNADFFDVRCLYTF